MRQRLMYLIPFVVIAAFVGSGYLAQLHPALFWLVVLVFGGPWVVLLLSVPYDAWRDYRDAKERERRIIEDQIRQARDEGLRDGRKR